MARRSLRPHLNQIRTWVRQGRTDAWIAHQLEVTVQQIEAFKREQGLAPDEEGNGVGNGEPRRRRSRRGGRRRRGGRSRRGGQPLEGTFDHGEEGYGLWLDPAVQDDPVYAGHWAGHRPVTVTIEEEEIVIRRAGDENEDEAGD